MEDLHIRRLKGKSVLLQFPEGLRHQAYDLARTLQKRNQCNVILLADPCYGACDLPVRSVLDSAGADVVIHLGHLPFPRMPKKIGRTRVIFFEMKMDLDLDQMLRVILAPDNLKKLGQHIGLATTAQYIHHLSEIISRLKAQGVCARSVKWGSRSRYPGQVIGCSFNGAMRFKGSSILYFGSGRFHPLGLALVSRVPVYQYDTEQGKLIDYSDEKDQFLRRRFALIARAQTANRFGILVSTKWGQRRITLAKTMKRVIEHQGKDAMIIMVDEVRPELLNYMGIDVWVNTACPRISIDDSERFIAPVLTPYETKVALGLEKWDKYKLDTFG